MFEGKEHCGRSMVGKEDHARKWERSDQWGSDEVGLFCTPPHQGLGLNAKGMEGL